MLVNLTLGRQKEGKEKVCSFKFPFGRTDRFGGQKASGQKGREDRGQQRQRRQRRRRQQEENKEDKIRKEKFGSTCQGHVRQLDASRASGGARHARGPQRADVLHLSAGLLRRDDRLRQSGLSDRVVPLRLHQPDRQAEGEMVLLEVYATLQEEEVMTSSILGA